MPGTCPLGTAGRLVTGLCVAMACHLVFPGTSLAGNEPRIRLLLEENAPRSIAAGEAVYVERYQDGRWRPVVDRISRAAFRPDPSGVLLEGTDLAADSFRVLPHYGMVRHNGKDQRGYLIISGSGTGVTTVASMPMESYLVGVVNGEVDSGWPGEAVRAQVVAARSFALFRTMSDDALWDLRADTADQFYAGVDSEDERAAEAVRSTRGQVLFRDGEVVPAFFHSSCGGWTSSALDIWGIPHPSLESVECGLCGASPRAGWELSLTGGEIAGAIRTLFPTSGTIRSFGIHRRTADGRVLTLSIGTSQGRLLVDAGDFRKVIGYQRLLSNRFSLAVSGESVIFRGAGYGHGVGLCQWGARGGALEGMTYREILEKYYPGAEVKRAY